MYYHKISTSMGDIHIGADDRRIKVITFSRTNWERLKKALGSIKKNENSITRQAESQLREYLEGKRTEFDLPISQSGTNFQQQCWQALLSIPYGETRSYSEQAELIHNPKAVRAVGKANNLNPIAIVIPCHRVIGKSGKLTGYADGLNIKQSLLQLEKDCTNIFSL